MSTLDDEAHVLTNRGRLLEALRVDFDQVVFARLTHGKDVSVFRADHEDAFPWQWDRPRKHSSHRERAFYTDAVISNVPGLHFFLTFADCVPLAFHDAKRGVIGAAHAGWRGAAQGIAREVVQAMRDQFGSDPADIVAGIGPSIGPCCYSVGAPVEAAFAAHGLEPVLQQRDTETFLDLWSSNQSQLLEAGVSSQSIEVAGVCTACHPDEYFSHRGEHGITGRLALCIGNH